MKIRFGTFNLYQFVEPPFSWYEPENNYSTDEWVQKKHWINDQLALMNCDIIGFQEVFSVNALQKLTTEAGYEFFKTVESPMIHPDDDSVYVSPVVALASKHPIVSVEKVQFEESLINDLRLPPDFKFSRVPIKANILIEGVGSVIVYVVHLKSKRPLIKDRPHPISDWALAVREALQERSLGYVASLLQRGAESAILYQDISETLYHNKDIPILLLGDLNDGEDSVVIEALTNRGQINDINGIPYSELPAEAKPLIHLYRLYDAFNLAPNPLGSKRAATHFYFGEGSVLDYIFVSNHLNPKNTRSVGHVTSYEVFDQHLKADGVGDDKQSDHAQVATTIDFKNSEG